MQRKHGVLSKKVSGIYIALKPGGSHIYEFNETAGYLWNLLAKPTKEDVLIAKLCKEYEVSRDKATQDVRKFIEQYTKEELITDSP